MNLEYFPQFLFINYPMVKNEASAEDVKTIGEGFKEYLQNKFKGKEDKLEAIWNIDAKHIVMNQVKKVPFLINGYHPALLIHFDDFIFNKFIK